MVKKKAPRRRRTSPVFTAEVDMHERVTILETQHQAHAETTKELVASVAAIQASLTRYQGFWGAVTLIASAVWAAFAIFKDNIVGFFKAQ